MMTLYKISAISGKGLGLVATEDIDDGGVLVQSTLIPLTHQEWDLIDGTTISEYVYTTIEHETKVHYLCLGDAALINHSDCPNISKTILDNNGYYSVLLKASRNIKRGEELCITYTNPDYYNL